jgi:DNA-binding transcriptional LysR family regulator
VSFAPLNALSAFIAVARRRSFAAAARDLAVSTSALSQSVRQLEERVGVPLLTRTSRSVALTDAGQRLLETAGPGVDGALEAIKTVTAKSGEVTGRLKMSVPGAAVPLVLTRVVPSFVRRHPGIELDIRVENRFVDIAAEGLDAGIRLVEAIDRDMVQVRLSGEARLVVVAAPSYLERKGVPKSPEDLAHHECLGFRLRAESDPFAWELERGKKTWRHAVRGCVTTNDRELLCALAVEGLGLMYTLEPLIADQLQRGSLRVVLDAYAPVVPGLFLYFPSRAQVSPALRAFLAFVREVAIIDERKGARLRA